ncbi:hypothetical protein ABC304_02740 [Microbacterium sp. 1P10UB]|uniref:hypothetical protein n=1 Tax=unclassified Microbacterium TaxID=2609290 RepID=UPI00399F36FD
MTPAARVLGTLAILLSLAAAAVPLASGALFVLDGEAPSFADGAVNIGGVLALVGLVAGGVGVFLSRPRPSAVAVVGTMIAAFALLGFVVAFVITSL